jgi:hypothetical protein
VPRPLTIYLDTSDLSVLYRATEGSDTCRIASELLRLSDMGAIAIGVSFPLIFEFLQDCDAEHQPDRLARARFLKRLCGSNAFPYISDMLEGADFRNDGIWLPRKPLESFTIKHLEQRLLARLRKELPASRAMRHKLANRKNFRALLAQNPNAMTLTEADLQGFPLSDEFLEGNYLRRFLLGRVSAASVDGVLRRWITDPESFFIIWYKYLGRTNALTEMIKEYAERLAIAFSTLNELHLSLRDSLERVAAAKRDLKKAWSNLPPELRKVIQRKTLSMKVDNAFPNATRFGETLGPDRAAVAAAFFKSRASGAKFQHSDLADLMHAMYLPLCDLWRGDRAFATMLLRAGVPHAEHIVPSLSELPSRIGSKL